MRKIAFAAIMLFFFALPVQADMPTEEARMVQSSKKVIQSTVMILAGTSRGTGFYISENEILTAFHVVRGNYKVNIDYHDKRCSATAGYRDEKLDIVILNTECKGIPVSFGDSVEIGQTVFGIGFPEYYSMVSKGIVGNHKWEFIISDIKAKTGMSGGPLANLNGEVIGIITSKSTLDPFVIFSVDYLHIKQFIDIAKG